MRAINSLDELTKKFIQCVCNSDSDRINLNSVMKKIRAKKRRIYDITNVLEGKLKLLFKYFYYIGIGLIKKDSKNQIRLKPEFYNLFNVNSNNSIELDEDENKKNYNYNNIIKLIELNNINNEIQFVNSLNEFCKEKILLYKGKIQKKNTNYDNNLNLNFLNKDNNKNNDKNKSINLFTVCHDDVISPEPSIDEIITILKQNNSCFDNKYNDKKELTLNLKQIKEKKEELSLNKNYENINSMFKEEYTDLFNKSNNNNDINYKSLKNKNFHFNARKDSFISDISSFGDICGFNYDKINIFE